MPRKKPSEEQIAIFIAEYAKKVHRDDAIGDAQRSLARRLRAAGYAVPERPPGPAPRFSAAQVAARKAAVAAWDAKQHAKTMAEFPPGLFAAFRCEKCKTVNMLNWKFGQRSTQARCEGCRRTTYLDRLPQKSEKV